MPGVHDYGDLESLAGAWAGIEQRRAAWLGDLQPAERIVWYVSVTRAVREQFPLWQTLLHVSNHITHHRSQACTALRAGRHPEQRRPSRLPAGRRRARSARRRRHNCGMHDLVLSFGLGVVLAAGPGPVQLLLLTESACGGVRRGLAAMAGSQARSRSSCWGSRRASRLVLPAARSCVC